VTTRLSNATLYDPANGVDGERRDLYLHEGRIHHRLPAHARVREHHDLDGMVVMAGGIDLHTHIAGGKGTLARLMLPEDQRAHPRARRRGLRSGGGRVVPTAAATGYRYAELGYTSCFEPAMLGVNARQVHAEFADIPMVDKGAYVLMGNDDFLLRLLQRGSEQALIDDYVAWMVNATHACAVKVVNPGGINAFKFNQRSLDLDEANCNYGVTPREVLLTLAGAVHRLGLPHPLHLHGCNLGAPGSGATTLRTIAAAEGLPLHLTHLQFHSYGSEGKRGFSSAAAELAEAINANPAISVDVGQVMFQQTMTASADTMHQYRGRAHAHPKRWMCMDIECDAGCGILPFRYRESNFVNALQWTIGLELLLLVEDPWRIFLTTDHPNGAPFEVYPQLIHLLMDRSLRRDLLAQIHPEAARMSTLGSIRREYSLYEIAVITRAGPARSLGLAQHGQLGAGAVADLTVYRPQRSIERMFARPEYVFKDGHLIVRKGRITTPVAGRTQRRCPEYDRGIERRLRRYFEQYHTMRFEHFAISAEEQAWLQQAAETAAVEPA